MTDRAVVPFEAMERMAQSIVKSRLFGIDDVDQALALMAVAAAEGKHPGVIARDYHLIQGRPAKKAEAMLRDFIESGGSVQWHQLDDGKADATFKHPQGGSVRITWDMARAQQAGLAGRDMYRKFPRQMLRSRCVSEGVRTVAPFATSGVYTPEEVQDMVPAPAEAEPVDVTPPKLTEEEVVIHSQAIAGAADLEELRRVFGTAYSLAKRINDTGRMLLFESLKDDRKQALMEDAA